MVEIGMPKVEYVEDLLMGEVSQDEERRLERSDS